MKRGIGFFQKGIAQLPVILVLVLMSVAIPATLKLTQQTQETRSSAAGSCGGNGQPCCITNAIPPTTYCDGDYKCTNGKCVSTKATPTPTPGSKSCGSHVSGSKWCDGDTLKKCEDGTIKTVTVCAYGCSGSSCKPADESKKCGSHNDGAVWCDGDVRTKCDAGSVSKKTCEYGCKNGSCEAAPTSSIANCAGGHFTGDLWCDGFIAMKCKNDGTVEKTYCSYEGKVCDYGECVVPTGTPTPTPKNLCEIGGGFCSAKKCGEAGYNSFAGGSYDSYCGSSSYCCGTSSTTPLPTSALPGDCLSGGTECYTVGSPGCSKCCNGHHTISTGHLAKTYCNSELECLGGGTECYTVGSPGCSECCNGYSTVGAGHTVKTHCNFEEDCLDSGTECYTVGSPGCSKCCSGHYSVSAGSWVKTYCGSGEGSVVPTIGDPNISCTHSCIPKSAVSKGGEMIVYDTCAKLGRVASGGECIDGYICCGAAYTPIPSKAVTGTSTPRPTNTSVPLPTGSSPNLPTNTSVPLPTEPASGGGPTATNVPDKKCSEPKGILARVQKTEKDALAVSLAVGKGEKVRLVCVSNKRKDKNGDPELAKKVKVVVSGPEGTKEYSKSVYADWSAQTGGEYRVQCVSTDKKCKDMSSNVAIVNVAGGGGSCFRCPNEGQEGVIGVTGGDFDCNNEITMDDVGLWVVEYNDTLINGAENDRKADPNCDGKATVDDLAVWIKAYNGGQNE